MGAPLVLCRRRCAGSASQETNRRSSVQFAVVTLVIVLASAFRPPIEQTQAADLASTDPMLRRLVAPMNSVVDGLAFRDAINSIGDQAGLNVWLDRSVDPTETVSCGPVGPSVYLALQRLADTRNCVVMPVANVVLVGRPQWIAKSVVAIDSVVDPDSPLQDSAATVDIQWDDLTSPSEALDIAAGSQVSIDPPLPHDLWPSIAWRRVDRRAAVAMIVAQFDRRLRQTANLQNLRTTDGTANDSVSRSYDLDESESLFRRQFLAADSDAKVRRTPGGLQATGSAEAHRKAIDSVLVAMVPQLPDPDEATFTIKRMRTTAENAFHQLAAMAGRRCEIDASVAQACKSVVSVAGQDLTLRQLIQLVADEVQLGVSWNDSSPDLSDHRRCQSPVTITQRLPRPMRPIRLDLRRVVNQRL